VKDKEFILAQFVLQPDDFRLFLRLRAYEKQGNLVIINHDQSSQILNGITCPIVDVKIEPSFATLLKLKDAELAERMRISYISDELKNKYRK
jgi:hypothetical protein